MALRPLQSSGPGGALRGRNVTVLPRPTASRASVLPITGRIERSDFRLLTRIGSQASTITGPRNRAIAGIMRSRRWPPFVGELRDRSSVGHALQAEKDRVSDWRITPDRGWHFQR